MDSLNQPELMPIGKVPQLSVAFLLIKQGLQAMSDSQRLSLLLLNTKASLKPSFLIRQHFPASSRDGTDMAAFIAGFLTSHMFLSKMEELAHYSEY